MAKHKQTSAPSGRIWLFGRHPVEAALANPQRSKLRLLATQEAARTLTNPPLAPEIVDKNALERQLPEGAVHQGLALLVEPLPGLTVEDLCWDESPSSLILALDRVSDPHNVGAVLRSAAAFGVAAVILPDRHAPEVSGILAKSASGAVEKVPLIRVPNLVQALTRLKKANYWVAGLAMEAPQTIEEAKLSGRIVLLIGAEEGMRRLSGETCDFLVKIPMIGDMESLNMSNAAAIALYELRRGAWSRENMP